jgi:ribose/xylose/arabinose/galactoside ABC-type transport system permease subunit
MKTTMAAVLERNRKFLPVASTAALFLLVYMVGFASFGVMRTPQAFFNLFDFAPFLIVATVGEGFVIISGGIDLSVSGILALTTVVAASLLNMGWNAWAIFPFVLLVGMAFGVVMGLFITYLKVQPFIATLAGMWLARGLCYVISDAEVRIHDSTYTTLGQTKILIPGLADPTLAKQPPYDYGAYITYLVVAAMAVFVFGLFVAHLTKFGRTMYAMGGGNGANEVSARLMGLPVNRTKVLVYTFSGFCSAVAGILYSIYVMSGRGNHGSGFELTAIAACVIGGIALTGGEGYLIGALVGCLITSLIPVLITYQGDLSSYWVYIVIGSLMLLFIGVQGGVAAWNAAAIGRSRFGGHAVRKVRRAWYQTRTARVAALVGAIALVGVFTYAVVLPFVFPAQQTRACELKPMRPDEAKALSDGGAVLVYERNGGRTCIDELYAVYADGRVTVDYAGDAPKKEMQLSPDQVNALLEKISTYGFFTDRFYSTHHVPCMDCFQYSTTATYKDQTKTVDAVDGGADAPSAYWPMTGDIAALLYPTTTTK